jgi:hypothetical protein
MPACLNSRQIARLISERSGPVPLPGSAIQTPSSRLMPDSANSLRKTAGAGSASTRGWACAAATMIAMARSRSLS